MATTILVAYATRYGSTREVAETIGATLRERRLVVDVRPARDVFDLHGYDAIVLGAPLYLGRFHGDAQRFMDLHADDLASLPVALFALGPLHDDEAEITSAHEQLDKEIAKHSWLTPIATEVFIGKYDPAHLTFPHRLLAVLPASPLHDVPALDSRDWVATRAWANDLASKFLPATPG